MSLREYKRRIELASSTMRTFCLMPTRERFYIVDKCVALQRKNPDLFRVWKEAVLYKFGPDWDMADDAFLSTDSLLSTCVTDPPSSTKAHSVLYIFCATGELKYIDLFYQYMGRRDLSKTMRLELADMYKKIRDEYTDEISMQGSDYIDKLRKLGVDIDSVNFVKFDNIKETLGDYKATHENHIKLIGGRKTAGSYVIETD